MEGKGYMKKCIGSRSGCTMYNFSLLSLQNCSFNLGENFPNWKLLFQRPYSYNEKDALSPLPSIPSLRPSAYGSISLRWSTVSQFSSFADVQNESSFLGENEENFKVD